MDAVSVFCWYMWLSSNQSFYRQFASYGKGVSHHKVGIEVNYKQNSYLTVIGVHWTMHLMHPNYYQITIIHVSKEVHLQNYVLSAHLYTICLCLCVHVYVCECECV